MKKRYQEKWENAYLTVKNARASRALRWALDPSQYWLASLARLRFATLAKSRKTFLGPPLDQILDPLVLTHRYRTHTPPSSQTHSLTGTIHIHHPVHKLTHSQVSYTYTTLFTNSLTHRYRTHTPPCSQTHSLTGTIHIHHPVHKLTHSQRKSIHF